MEKYFKNDKEMEEYMAKIFKEKFGVTLVNENNESYNDLGEFNEIYEYDDTVPLQEESMILPIKINRKYSWRGDRTKTFPTLYLAEKYAQLQKEKIRETIQERLSKISIESVKFNLIHEMIKLSYTNLFRNDRSDYKLHITAKNSYEEYLTNLANFLKKVEEKGYFTQTDEDEIIKLVYNELSALYQLNFDSEYQ